MRRRSPFPIADVPEDSVSSSGYMSESQRWALPSLVSDIVGLSSPRLWSWNQIKRLQVSVSLLHPFLERDMFLHPLTEERQTTPVIRLFDVRFIVLNRRFI